MDRRNFFTVMAAWALAFVFNPIKLAKAPRTATLLNEWPDGTPRGMDTGPYGQIIGGAEVNSVGVFGREGQLLSVSKFKQPFHVLPGDTLEITYKLDIT